jgi:UDP-N-acetylmuramyl tripeptide synthase
VDGIATVVLGGETVAIPLAARGTYNAQNATAIALAALQLEIPVEIITTRISEVLPAFGRGERITIGTKTVTLQLVKKSRRVSTRTAHG